MIILLVLECTIKKKGYESDFGYDMAKIVYGDSYEKYVLRLENRKHASLFYYPLVNKELGQTREDALAIADHYVSEMDNFLSEDPFDNSEHL